MNLKDLVREYGSQVALAKALGCDKSYLNRFVSGGRTISPALAIRIFNVTGNKLGPLSEERAA